MRIAFVIYPGFTALDLIGPYEVLSRWPGADTRFVATQTGPVRADMGLTVIPTDTPATLPTPDVVVMPGASDPLKVLEDAALVEWTRQAAASAKWMASVCTGAGVFAKAGLLEGRRSTTHWGFRDNLKAMGVEVLENRVVFDPPFVSGAGVSAGIDMALALTARVHGDELAQALQLGIEYDPEPLFDAGAPDKASPSTVRLAMKVLMADQPGLVFRSTQHILRHRLRRLRSTSAR
jgi:transcriptional regulator GlxA family with amidase domain